MVYTQTRISPWECESWNSQRRWDTNESFNPDQVLINQKIKKKKKRFCRLVDFTVPVNHKVKMKEREKNWQTIRSIQRTDNVVEHVGGVDTNNCWLHSEQFPMGLRKRLAKLEIGYRLEIVLITALLESGKILRRVLETWGDLLSVRL